MTFLTELDFNLKGGNSVKLGQYTLITGANGSGKSAIVNAAELLLGDFVSDVAGRESLKLPADLITLAPPGHDLKVRGVFADGAESRVTVARKEGGGAQRPDNPSRRKAIFPIQEVEVNLKSPDKARKYVAELMGSMVGRVDIMSALDPAFHDAYSDAAKRQVGSETEKLEGVIVGISSVIKERKRRGEEADRIISAMGANLDEEPSDEELRRAEQASQAYAQAFVAQQGHDRAHTRAQGLLTELTAIQQRLAELGVWEGTASSDGVAISTRIELWRDTLARGDWRCTLCKAEINPEQAQVQIGALVSQKDRRKLEEDKARVEREISQIMNVIQKPRPELPPNVDYAGMRALKNSWQAVNKARAVKAELAENQAKDEALLKALKSARDHIADEALKHFHTIVQKYLPESDVFRMEFEVEGRSACRYGFDRDGTLHTALSGAEWSRLLLALAGAVCELRKREDALFLITPPERAYDSASLALIMRALEGANAQVLITSPHKMKGRLPKGWTLIELDK